MRMRIWTAKHIVSMGYKKVQKDLPLSKCMMKAPLSIQTEQPLLCVSARDNCGIDNRKDWHWKGQPVDTM